MDKFWEIVVKILESKLFHSFVVVLISIILYKIIGYFLTRGEEKAKFKLFMSNKGKTYVKLLKNIIRYVFIIITILVVLQINGINVSSVLAGVGIFGVIFGLAIQDWLKDIIRGSSIISDGYFEVGDIIKYNGVEGKVLVIGLKTTKIQDLATSNILSIANRNIEQVEVISNLIYVRAPLPYEVSVQKAEDVMGDVVKEVLKNPHVKGCHYKGVAELADSCIEYLIEVEADALYKLQTRRDTLRTILLVLEQHKIEVPYQQIDIHNK